MKITTKNCLLPIVRIVQIVIATVLLANLAINAFSQSPTPTPDDRDDRGLGIQSSGTTKNSQSGQQSREAKPELVLQTGYNSLFGATRLVFSPDGRLLATGTFRSGTVKLWETATGRELRNLSTGTQSAMGLSPLFAFSRDSRLVAAAAGDGSVKIWDVTTGLEVQTLAAAQSSVLTSFGISFIAFSRDNQIITISDAIRVWDVVTGRELRRLDSASSNMSGNLSGNMSGFTGGAGGAALSRDGNQLASVVGDGSEAEIKFWDTSTGKELRSVTLSKSDLNGPDLSFTADGRLLVAGIVEKRLKLWELSSKSNSPGNERELGPTTQDYSPVKFSGDARLVSLAEGQTVRVWDAATGRELQNVKVPTSGLASNSQFATFASFSEDGKKLATGGFDTPTILWESETGKQLLKMSGRTNMAYKVAFSADGNRLTSGGRTRWDLRTGRGLRISSNPSDKMLGVPSPDGRLLAAFTMNSNAVSILEAPNGRVLQTLAPGASGGVVQRVSFSADGTMLLTSYGLDPEQMKRTTLGSQAGNLANELKIWDVKSGRELRTIVAPSVLNEFSLSADGKILGTLGSQGEIGLWDATSGARLQELSTSPMANLNSIMQGMGSINPGMPGKPGKSGRPNPAMRIPGAPANMPQMPSMTDINAMMTNVLGSMSAGTMGRTVTSIAFSPDGKLLATGGVESKSNLDQIALMAGNPGKKNSKNSRNSSDPQELMKDLKVEASGRVVLWDTTTGQQIAELKPHGKGITQVSFSRDGRLLASSSTDNTIKIWDVAGRREIRTLTGHTTNIDSIDFSPDSRLLASASDDGSTFLWDANSGEHLLTLISLDDGGEWMVVTPQGLFDGTPVSWNQILWRYDRDTFNVAPIEWFFNEFYYPGLLADIMAGKRPKVAQDVSKKDRRQPTVKLSIAGDPTQAVATRTVKIKIDVTDALADKDHPQGTGARDLRLFRNGSLVKVWHGDVLKGQATVTLEEEVTVAAGVNRLTAYAFNTDNVKSKDAQLPLTGADSLKRPGVAYIIAVGLNEYANPQYNLKYAVADAQSFGEEVRRGQAQVGGFERIEVVPLLNENATKENIISALKRLTGAPRPPSLKAGPLDRLKPAEPEDTVIIYFAGHGTAQSQRFYLIPHDLGYTGERNKLNEQGLRTILDHSISDLELEEAVEGMDAGHLLLIIDACNSGQALEAEEKRRGPMNSKGLAQLAYEKGMFILTAAQSYQAALEAAQLGHGLLTYALVEEGLKTQIADTQPKDGILSAREWLDFATERVPEMQEEKMKQSRGVGLAIAFTEGEQNIADPGKRNVQRPRVFYRRELESNRLVIAKQ